LWWFVVTLYRTSLHGTGRYKAAHGRVKTHAESIAFFNGDAREKRIVNDAFDEVSRLAHHRVKVSLSFGVVSQAIVREAPMLVQWILRNECVTRNTMTSSKAA
jgi:ABC-type uncharacterized transport system fused permease/ATPase subunit